MQGGAAPVLRSPTVTRSGSLSTLRARFSTASGSVAEKSARTHSRWLHAATTASTWGEGRGAGGAERAKERAMLLWSRQQAGRKQQVCRQEAGRQEAGRKRQVR